MTQAILYAAGVATGVIAMLLHQRSINKALSAERARFNRRIQELEAERRTADCADAYRRGKQDSSRLRPAPTDKLIQRPE